MDSPRHKKFLKDRESQDPVTRAYVRLGIVAMPKRKPQRIRSKYHRR